MNKKTDLETVGAMHQCKKGEAFSTCTHCGAMAEQLAKPCPHFMRQAGEMLEARASLSLPAAGQEPVAWQYRSVRDTGAWFDCAEECAKSRAEHPDKWNVRYLYAAPQPAVAAGWVMVPVVPSEPMKKAAKAADMDHSDYRDWIVSEWPEFLRIWTAMLKAAPLPPAPSTEGEKA